MTPDVPGLPLVFSLDLFPDLERRPRLLLGVDPDVLTRGTQLREGRSWHYLQHQTSGLSCTQVYLVATELTPRPEREAGLLELADRYADSNFGLWGTTIDNLVGYRETLRALVGVECAVRHRDFQEAVYPVDVTPEHLRHLSADDLPADLEELLEFDSP